MFLLPILKSGSNGKCLIPLTEKLISLRHIPSTLLSLSIYLFLPFLSLKLSLECTENNPCLHLALFPVVYCSQDQKEKSKKQQS